MRELWKEVSPYPDDLVVVKTGKNQNTIYAQNESGNNAELIIRVNRGSDDDKFLQGKLNEQKRDLSSFTTGKGQFTKHLGDGDGNVTRDVYNLVGGVFTKNTEGKDNTDGDTEQAVAIYNMKFSLADRNLA